MKTSGLERRRFAPAVLLLLLALILVLDRSLSLLFPGLDQDAAGLYLLDIVQELLLWLLPALFMLPWRHARLGPKRDVLPMEELAFFAGAALQIIAIAVERLLPVADSGSVAPAASGWLQNGLLVLSMTVFPAICEEAFFRGCFTSHLMDVLPPVWACVWCTAVFAFSHGSLYGLPRLLLLGLFCTLLMMYTGRVWGGMAAHFGFNLMSLCYGALPASPWILLCSLLPVWMIARMLRRMDWHRPGEQPKAGKPEWLLLILLLLASLARFWV